MAPGLAALWLALPAVAPPAQPRSIEAPSFVIPIPDGYTNVSELVASRGFPRKQVTLRANTARDDDPPTITFQLAPIWGGTLADLALCKQSAASIAGPTGKVRSAVLIDGPAPSGKVCQMHLVLPEGVALITELVSPAETWLMTCNHADGDAAAEKVCRATLAAFKFKKLPPVAPKIVLPRIGVRECDDYLDKFVACLSRRVDDRDLAPMRALVETTAATLKKSAASEEGRKSLPATCSKTLAQTKSMLEKSVGCEW